MRQLVMIILLLQHPFEFDCIFQLLFQLLDDKCDSCLDLYCLFQVFLLLLRGLQNIFDLVSLNEIIQVVFHENVLALSDGLLLFRLFAIFLAEYVF